MFSKANITELNRLELLHLALTKLRNYRNENREAVDEKYNFSHLPKEIEDLADLVFLRTYKPLHGFLPSSHYVCHVNTMIEKIESRVAQYEASKTKVDTFIENIKQEFKLTGKDVKALQGLVYKLLDDTPPAECLSLAALTIMQEGVNFETKELNLANLGLRLAESALSLSQQSLAKEDEFNGPPKRYAFLLAEMHANAIKELTHNIEFDADESLKYIRLASELGSQTATHLLLEEDPVDDLLVKNGIEKQITSDYRL